jgi:dTDP-4-amino-4,6-dideoxygalactose transaminase
MEELTKIATRHNINILEDAAQAHGARVGDQQVGSFGVTAAFSFYPTKNMTSGEGGMVTTQCPHIERKLRLLRNQGMEKRYENEVIGFNLRMTDIHAAIGRVQLQRLGEWTAARQANAAYLTKHIEGVITPKIANGCTHVFHQYTIQLLGDFRDEFANQLSSNGVGNGVYYPTPIHRLPSFEKRVDLPVTEKVAARVLSLPVHPSLTPENLEQIVSVVNDAAKYFS